MKMLLLTLTCYENVVVVENFLLVMKMLLLTFELVMKMLLLTFYLL